MKFTRKQYFTLVDKLSGQALSKHSVTIPDIQSCRTRVLDLDSSRTRDRFLADLDLDSVVKDSDLDLDLNTVFKDSDLDLDLDITCLQTTAVHLAVMCSCQCIWQKAFKMAERKNFIN